MPVDGNAACVDGRSEILKDNNLTFKFDKRKYVETIKLCFVATMASSLWGIGFQVFPNVLDGVLPQTKKAYSNKK